MTAKFALAVNVEDTVAAPAIATVPSVPLEILSPFPKVISLPVTVRSPLTDVVVAVMATVPSVLFVMVSSFCKIIPV